MILKPFFMSRSNLRYNLKKIFYWCIFIVKLSSQERLNKKVICSFITFEKNVKRKKKLSFFGTICNLSSRIFSKGFEVGFDICNLLNLKIIGLTVYEKNGNIITNRVLLARPAPTFLNSLEKVESSQFFIMYFLSWFSLTGQKFKTKFPKTKL